MEGIEIVEQRREILLEVLYDHGAYGRFINILSQRIAYRGVQSSKAIFNDFTIFNRSYDWVNSLCTWRKTDEGQDYWSNIHEAYHEAVKWKTNKGPRCHSIW